MSVIKAILVLVEVLTSILLVAVILLQKTKDEGLGLAFGGAMGESLFGSRAGNVLTKITITLAVVFMANTLVLALIYSKGGETSLVDRAPVSASPLAPSAVPAAAEPGPGSAQPATPAAMPAEAPAPAAPAEGTPAPSAGGAADAPVAK